MSIQWATRILGLLLIISLIMNAAPVFCASGYYIIENTVSGYYYAVYTDGVAYQAFYIDSSGAKQYINTYWWDANTSYIIFQSPINGTVYLEETTGFSTFYSVDQELPVSMFSSAYQYTVTFPSSDWSPQSVSGYLYDTYTINERSIVFDGISLTLYYNVTYNFTNTTVTSSISNAETSYYIYQNTEFTATYQITNVLETISVNVTTQGYYEIQTSTGTLVDTVYDEWVTRPSNINYDYGVSPLSYSITTDNVTVTRGGITNYSNPNDYVFVDYWEIGFLFPQGYNITATSTVEYTVQNGVITTGNNVYVIYDLSGLQQTSGELLVSVTREPDLEYYLPGQTVNITFTMLFPDGNAADGVNTDVYVNAQLVANDVNTYPFSFLVSVNAWGLTQIDFISDNPITGGTSVNTIILYPHGYNMTLEGIEIDLSSNASVSVNVNGSLSLPDYIRLMSESDLGRYAITVLPLLFLLLGNRVWSGIAILISSGLMLGVNQALGTEFFSSFWASIVAFVGLISIFTEMRGRP